MFAQCSIAIRSEAGPIYAISCHSDGFPECVGATLAQHYQGRGEVWKLINLGHISRLGNDLVPVKGTPHNFMTPQHDVTLAYGRDCGRGNCKAVKFGSITAWKSWAAINKSEYVYLYDELQREWFFAPAYRLAGQILPAKGLKHLVPPTPQPVIPRDPDEVFAPIMVVLMQAA